MTWWPDQTRPDQPVLLGNVAAKLMQLPGGHQAPVEEGRHQHGVLGDTEETSQPGEKAGERQ